MSYATLKKVIKDGDVVNALELHNAWLFQPFVWGILSKACNINTGLCFDNWEKLFKLVRDRNPLKWFEWNVLQFTYDQILISKEDMPLLAESLIEFHKIHGTELPHNHCNTIVKWIEEQMQIGDCFGMALYGTSVTDDLWWVRNEEADEDRPYNINSDTGHTVAKLRQRDTIE